MRQQFIDFKEKFSGLKVAQKQDNYFDQFKHPIVIAGPCAVESYDQMLAAARSVQAQGAQMLRAGAFKPRTSPYSFQGLELEGLQILSKVRQAVRLPVVSEIMDGHMLDHFLDKVDILQIGSRNMQNFALLKAIGQSRKPVILKRGISATIEEFLMAAEYILSHGNPNVCLCERGIRTFETVTRNTLDLNAVAILKQVTHLPVIVDPSHGTGIKSLITPMSQASLALGADGIMVEVHPKPEEAQSDKEHALSLGEFGQMMQVLAPQLR